MMGVELRRQTKLFEWGPLKAILYWGTHWPSVTGNIGPATFNTKRGFSSIRLGRGWSYRDRDR